MSRKDKDKRKNTRPPAADTGSDTAAERRVALLRHKLTKAMDDPLMRDQIVKAIRTMMSEDK